MKTSLERGILYSMTVEFFEEDKNTDVRQLDGLLKPDQEKSIAVRLLLKTGIVRTSSEAQLIIIISTFLIIGFSLILLFYKTSQSKTIKKTYYEDIPAEVRGRLPEGSKDLPPHRPK